MSQWDSDQMSETFRFDYKTLEVYLWIFLAIFVLIKLFFTLPLQSIVYFWYKFRYE